MNLKQIIQFLVIVLVGFGFTVNIYGVSLTANPSVVGVGETVTFRSTINITDDDRVTPTAELQFKYGDGFGAEVSINVLAGGSETHTRTHSYKKPGLYNATAKGIPTIDCEVGAPLNVSQAVFVGKTKVPVGTVGASYEYNFGASVRGSFRKVGGKLPPGLELSNSGLISGVPLERGTFNSTVQIAANGVRANVPMTIYIDPAKIIFKITPSTIDAPASSGASKKVTYTVVSPDIVVNQTLQSQRGEFVVGGRTVGYMNKPLSVSLSRQPAKASESISIPQNVLQAARQKGLTKFTYKRHFSSRLIGDGYAEVTIHLRTAAAGNLRFTKLRVYFEKNNRPLIQVERNSRGLTGAVDIHYNGSGVLKGFWKVDNRIIQRVQKNVFYGKVLTLKTPNAPPLPTYSEGAHKLQFIITEPVDAFENIDFPEAIYHVEAKKAAVVTSLALKTPSKDETVGEEGMMFTWDDPLKIKMYTLEFFEPNSEEPFFTAYIKEGSYHLLPKVISLKFTSGKNYIWQVRGFNKMGEVAAESPKRELVIQ